MHTDGKRKADEVCFFECVFWFINSTLLHNHNSSSNSSIMMVFVVVVSIRVEAHTAFLSIFDVP